ncbi:glycosyltransferase family 2 protein [Spirosoma pulveris]
MVSVVIPTYNAENYLPSLFDSLQRQTQAHELICIDSESNYATQALLQREGVRVVPIKKNKFNHGTTRNLGVELSTYDTIIFLTQDALPASPYTLQTIVENLYSRDDIAMAYGRQLPYTHTGPFGKLARYINYPDKSIIKTSALIPEMGIRACSCSNSFAAYRKSDLLTIGGFPENIILGEDVTVAAHYILHGKAVSYCAEAEVFHSHDYSLSEEFKRYFDIGVFHNEQRDVLKYFKQTESEGFKYFITEFNYLKDNNYLHLVIPQVVRTLSKYIGYKLGTMDSIIPLDMKRKLSMHKSYWI